MGVRKNTYVIFGVSYPYDHIKHECESDPLGPFVDNSWETPRSFEELTALVDGMNGRYVIIGHVLSRSDDSEGEMFDEPLRIPTEMYANTRLAAIYEKFPPPADKSHREGWFVVTHYR